MTFPHSNKTVIVLDRREKFLMESKLPSEVDIFTKPRGTGIIPLRPIYKSLWTCNVEAIMEYCRVVYDVYPLESQISIIASDKEAATVTNWEKPQQSVSYIMQRLAQTGGPVKYESKANEGNIIHGLDAALQQMCLATDAQMERINAHQPIVNNGRIICLTQISGESQLKFLRDCLKESLPQHNKLAEANKNANVIPINHVEVVFIHVLPAGEKSIIRHQDRQELSENLSVDVHCSQSGHFINSKMVELCCSHFRLSSTTVTGIPMKEELNAQNSANYDVELLHSSDAHEELIKTGNREGLTIRSKEALNLDTVTLKWCTPKTNNVELHQTTGAFRVTPVDVNSRPSSCLTNFLLNGRSVMLEQPRKTGVKVISHMLTSHGGELYIHVLATQRSCLEDPPSVSEGSGGRITDYRITDFCELIKDTRLAPMPKAEGRPMKPIEKARAQMERMTRYWPMVLGDTIIFNILNRIEPLHTLMVKEKLDQEEVQECKKAIINMVNMEVNQEQLPALNNAGSTRGKGQRREENYRQMWLELDRFIRSHASTSPEHQQVLECLTDCKGPSIDSSKNGDVVQGQKREHEEDMTIDDQVLNDFEKFNEANGGGREKRSAGDSPLPPIKRAKTSSIDVYLPKSGKAQSLYSLWSTQVQALNSIKCQEFAYRVDHGNKAPLYQHMKDNLPPASNQATPQKQDQKNGDKTTSSIMKPLISNLKNMKR